ncbi:MAG: rhodanese-like domain-containing protein [Planctomycetota bacterium]|nr:rhodanese-like domain-containing protein [Planctomycetota bacterium]
MRTLSLAAALYALAACNSLAVTDPPAFPDISVDAAADLVAAGGDVVVLDIRTPDEYAAGHLPGAVLMDCKAPDFADKLKTLDPSKTYVMH